MRLKLGLQQFELRLCRLALRGLGPGAGERDFFTGACQLLAAHEVVAQGAAGEQTQQQIAQQQAWRSGAEPGNRVPQQRGSQGQADRVAEHDTQRHQQVHASPWQIRFWQQPVQRRLDQQPDAHTNAVRINQVNAKIAHAKSGQQQGNDGVDAQTRQTALRQRPHGPAARGL